MSIQIVNNLSEEKWRRFVNDHPEGNIFHTPEMFKIFELTKGYQPQLWAAISDKKVLALFLPVEISLINGILHRLTTRSVAYGGVICRSTPEGKSALGQLLENYTKKVKKKSLFTELRNLTNLGELQPILNRYGFVYEDYLNYLIKLNRSADFVFQNIGRRTRKHIRRELRRNKVNISVVKEEKQLAACYDLLLKTYRFARVPLADRSLFDAAFKFLSPAKMIRFTAAYIDRTPIAVSVDLIYKDVIFGWFGGMDRSFASYMPNELIMWDVLKWGSENGFRIYDFGGAGKPGEKYGVRDFKAKFGGELVCFGRNSYIHSPFFLNLSKIGYGILRPVLYAA
jgi:hypothetical protein